MDATTKLMDRIDAEFSAAQEHWNQLRTKHLEAYQDRRQRLEQFERAVDGLRDVWEPRLDVLAKKFGKDMDVHPTVEPARRGMKMNFESSLARITLRFGVAPDADIRNLVFTYDVEILPVLMSFNSHQELQVALDDVDEAKFGQWLDDRIVDFVHTYFALHENEYYLKDQLVEDPIAKVKFPKFAAGAKLEQNGRTLYFIDESTCREFQHASAASLAGETGRRVTSGSR
ncbi:MAG: hypothetical protein AB7V46_21225 [Thermomicrobiales bacterium]